MAQTLVITKNGVEVAAVRKQYVSMGDTVVPLEIKPTENVPLLLALFAFIESNFNPDVKAFN